MTLSEDKLDEMLLSDFKFLWDANALSLKLKGQPLTKEEVQEIVSRTKQAILKDFISKAEVIEALKPERKIPKRAAMSRKQARNELRREIKSSLDLEEAGDGDG